MASRVYRPAGLRRSLTLLRVFLLASAAILAVGAVVLSTVLAESLREQALGDRAREVSLYADSVLAPSFVRGDRLVARPGTFRRIARTVRPPRDLVGVYIWKRNARLAASTLPRPYQLTTVNRVRATLRERTPQAEVTRIVLNARRPAETTRVVAVWAPLLTEKGKAAGVAEILLRPRALDASVTAVRNSVWLTVAGVFAVLWLALALLVRGASARLARQTTAVEERTRELMQTTRALERTLIETIETLNAAVEARDPYTAGHSQRVRRVALAIGRELALPATQLGALATAALFHDIGKIGMPDSILTKPAPLAPDEAAIMRRHVERGAEIAAKVSSFSESVPAIRYHHERWDGLGYPDGLRHEEIPLEAAIICLADAWDAMTTDRPYSNGLPLHEALEQVRQGRGSQFSPKVVDAFLGVARRRPGDVLPPDTAAQSAIAI